MKISLTKLFPILASIQTYRPSFLAGDLVAGITVGIILIPQGMAYAMLAGLSPEVGLYASFLPLIVYAIWGTSPYISIAPVAITSLVVGQALAPIVGNDLQNLLVLACLLAFLEGSLQFVMGFLRLGFIINFMSLPVIQGYISAASIAIIISQFSTLLGLPLYRNEKPFQTVIEVFKNLNQSHSNTVITSLIAITLLIYSKRLLQKHLLMFSLPPFWSYIIPKATPIIVLIGGALVVQYGFLQGVELVGALPLQTNTIQTPVLNLDNILILLPIAGYICLISFMETISVGTTLANRDGKKLNANKELKALGMANIASSFSGGFSVSGSLSRSIVNYDSGAKTSLSSIITASMIITTILFFSDYLAFLPRAILSSVIVVAIYTMIQFKSFKSIARLSKIDLLSFLATFFAVIFLGVKHGLIVGVLTSVFLYMWVTSKPHIAIVGRVKKTEHFRNVLRHQVEVYPQMLVIRIDESLTFVNSKFLEEALWKIIKSHSDVNKIVISATNINHIDFSALINFKHFIIQLKQQNYIYAISEIKGPVMDFLIKANFHQEVGEDNIYLSTHLAVNTLRNK